VNVRSECEVIREETIVSCLTFVFVVQPRPHWVRVSVSAGLPMNCFDNKELRKAVFMTKECGQRYRRTKPDLVLSRNPHCFTTKLIPKLDKFIDDKNMHKVREMINHNPIVNIIMGVRSLHTLRVSIDTMGEQKTMDFITVHRSTHQGDW
jgi:hypothetical protein